MIIGSMVWRPFDSRFCDLLARMRQHHVSLFEEFTLLTSNQAKQERIKADAERLSQTLERERSSEDRQEAMREREQAQKERELMAEQRRQTSIDNQVILAQLREVRRQMENLESSRMGTYITL